MRFRLLVEMAGEPNGRGGANCQDAGSGFHAVGAMWVHGNDFGVERRIPPGC